MPVYLIQLWITVHEAKNSVVKYQK
jgi:hypothetical protein